MWGLQIQPPALLGGNKGEELCIEGSVRASQDWEPPTFPIWEQRQSRHYRVQAVPLLLPTGKGADTDSRTRVPYPPSHSRPQWLTLCHSGVRVCVPTAQAGRRNPGDGAHRAQEGKCFLAPPVCQTSLLCPHRPECPAPTAHRPPPQSPASKQPAAEGLNPGGLTLPGEADAIQPGLLEAQMGRVSAPL